MNVSEEYVLNMQMTKFVIPRSKIDVSQLGGHILSEQHLNDLIIAGS